MQATSPLLKKPSTLVFIDALRGIAALLVLYFHLQLHIFDNYPATPITPGSYTDLFLFGKIDLGKFAVGVFFIISGYLIPATLRGANADLRKYAVHRIFRLYPAYWISILVAVLTAYFLNQKIWSTQTILINLTMLQKFVGVPDVIGVFWTLQIELIFYVLCAIFFLFGILDRRLSIFGFILVATIAAAVARSYTGKGVPVALFIALLLMFFGDLLRGLRSGQAARGPVVVAGITLFASMIPICLLAYDDEGLRYLVTYWLSISVFLLAWMYQESFPTKGSIYRLLTFLGSISYGVYLLHDPIALKIGGLLFRVTNSYLLTAAFGVLATIFASWLLFHFVENPFIRMGKRVGKRWEPGNIKAEKVAESALP